MRIMNGHGLVYILLDRSLSTATSFSAITQQSVLMISLISGPYFFIRAKDIALMATMSLVFTIRPLYTLPNEPLPSRPF